MVEPCHRMKQSPGYGEDDDRVTEHLKSVSLMRSCVLVLCSDSEVTPVNTKGLDIKVLQ